MRKEIIVAFLREDDGEFFFIKKKMVESSRIKTITIKTISWVFGKKKLA